VLGNPVVLSIKSYNPILSNSSAKAFIAYSLVSSLGLRPLALTAWAAFSYSSKYSKLGFHKDSFPTAGNNTFVAPRFSYVTSFKWSGDIN
jgi:hypothetical protein